MNTILHQWHVLMLAIASMINREQAQIIDYLKTENRVLKEQLKKHGRIRCTDRQRRLLAVKAKQLGRAALRKLDTIVCPDTLLRWFHQVVAQKYDGSAKRGPGRPRIMKQIEALIVRMASECPSWGYTRIRGALWNIGHDVGRTTIANVLARHGIEPAPNHKTMSETLVNLVAERCNIDDELGVKGKSGVLKSKKTRKAFLEDSEHRIRFVYTPRHTSWLNQIECWFSILVRRLLKRASFRSLDELEEKLRAFIDYFNAVLAKPFKWTYTGRPLQA